MLLMLTCAMVSFASEIHVLDVVVGGPGYPYFGNAFSMTAGSIGIPSCNILLLLLRRLPVDAPAQLPPDWYYGILYPDCILEWTGELQPGSCHHRRAEPITSQNAATHSR